MVNTQKLAREAMSRAVEEAEKSRITPIDMGTTISGSPKFTRRMDGADGGQPTSMLPRPKPAGAFE